MPTELVGNRFEANYIVSPGARRDAMRVMDGKG